MGRSTDEKKSRATRLQEPSAYTSKSREEGARRIEASLRRSPRKENIETASHSFAISPAGEGRNFES